MVTQNILSIIAIIIVIGYYGEKLLRSYKSIKKLRYKDSKAEFSYDLYALQQKWNKRGEYDLVQIIEILKESLHLPPEEKIAETTYGKQFQKDIKDLYSE